MEYDQRVNIDLHIHSTASDGTLSPAEIINLASTLGLGAISITDHDTLEGAKSALRIQRPSTLQFIPGVEISVSPLAGLQQPGTFHLLGYGINVDDPQLNHTLDILKTARQDRNLKIIQKLDHLGLEITMDEVIEESADADQIGRPHIAEILVKKGFAKSIDDAFQTYLAVGKPAYINKFRLDCKKAIEIISNAGGIPVLAHPFLIALKSGVDIETFVVTLKAMGLQGIEVYYPDHTQMQTVEYKNIAKRHGLLITGGTDFHGDLKPEIQMGSGKGDFSVPYDFYEKIAAKLWKQ